MIKLLIIADDFTGALDTGVQFSSQGIETLVSTKTKISYDSIPEEIEVLVVNTESRHLNFDDAYKITRKIIEDANHIGISYIYKKVDSALRGNISAEIKAMLDTCEQDIIPFLPSYPEMNRVLLKGNLYIEGVLVSESIFANDPYEPVTESNIIRRLENEAKLQATLIVEDELPKNTKGIWVFDSQTKEDLKAQVDLLEQENLLAITIGCAGFAKVLAKKLFLNGKDVTYSLNKPLVVICGSLNPITKKQVEYVEKKKYSRISLSANQLLDEHYWKHAQGKIDIENYLDLLGREPLIVFETFSDQTMYDIGAHGIENGLSASNCRFKIGESLGKLTEALWEKYQENTFLFTGGDTLFQSMKILGVTEIKPVVEIRTGVVLSTIEWNNQQMKVITKSGGFGSEVLFEEIVLN